VAPWASMRWRNSASSVPVSHNANPPVARRYSVRISRGHSSDGSPRRQRRSSVRQRLQKPCPTDSSGIETPTAPASRPARTARSTTSGCSSMSASTYSTHSPAACAMPRLRWALRSGPPRRARSAWRTAAVQVPSVEPLSTTISSRAG
jgi:hypothetical protein